MVIPAQFKKIDSFYEGLAAAEQGSKWGFIDKTGKMIIILKKGWPDGSFSEGLAAVGKANYGD